MRITIKPKEQFCKSVPDDEKAQYTTFMASPLVRNAASLTLAQMAVLGASKEALAGAELFAHIFMNLADVEDKLPEFPTKELKTY